MLPATQRTDPRLAAARSGALDRAPLRAAAKRADGGALTARHGFTLIELLVVVSIVALLVALLLPALGRAKREAKITVCGTRLQQLGVAVTNYSNDFKGWYPHRLNGWYNYLILYDNTASGKGDDRPMLRNYTRYDPVLTCPLAPLPAGKSIDTSNATDYISVSFEMWFGFDYKLNPAVKTIRRVGDLMDTAAIGSPYRFRVLAADRFMSYEFLGTQAQMTHPAGRANFDQSVPTSTANLYAQWNLSDPAQLADIDRNFLRDDGSVRRITRLSLSDSRTRPVPAAGQTLLYSYTGYLPPE